MNGPLRFTNGGFVCHKIRLTGLKSNVSAWFDRDGKLLDCEAIDSRFRSRPVHPARFPELQAIGNRHKHTPTLAYTKLTTAKG
jgi:hypothetical protein